MHTVNMFQAKSNLSRLVEAVESGAESEIIIARDGQPAAKLVPIDHAPKGQRIGVASGKFAPPDPDPTLDAAIAKLFATPTKP